jgi:agmatinase
LLSTYDVETNTDVSELNIHTLDSFNCPESPLEAVEELFRQATQHFKKNKLVASIGGSHLISLGLVRAALEQYDNLSVLHFGAHPHLIASGDNAASEETNVMGRIREKCEVSHIGVRSMTKAERGKVHLDNLVFARDIYNNGLNAAADAIDLLSEKVYIAIHLDILDPACMPAVARPEPGGLDWYTLNALIRMVAREKSVVGFDVTGFVPQKEGMHTQLLAAKLVYKTLICIMQNKF